MSAAAVVIELPAGSEVASPVQDLVRACSDHLRVPGGCVVAEETEGPTLKATRAVAIVWWGPGQRTARVQVGLRSAERAEWPTAELVFRAEDAPAERWKAVGLAIAALVGEDAGAAPDGATRSTPAPSSAPLGSRPPEPVSAGSDSAVSAGPARPAPSRSQGGSQSEASAPDEDAEVGAPPETASGTIGHPAHAWIDAAGAVASGALWGGALRGFYRVGDTHWMAFASAAYVTGTVASPNPSVQLSRAETGAGGAFAHKAGPVLVEAHTGLFYEWLRASGSDLARGQDAARRTTGGLLLGGSAGFTIVPAPAAFAGADVLGRLEETEVRAGSLTVFRVPTLDWTAIAGIRVGLD